MRIDELFSQNDSKKELDFDLADDLIFFMQNDHEFYRTEVFPVLSKLQKYYKLGKDTSPIMFKNLVLRAYNTYKAKFPIDELEDTLTMEQVKEICNKLYHTERSQLEK